MAIVVLPPTEEHPEPVYLYDDPNLHPIQFFGHYIDQKGIARIRMMVANPRDIDRLCQVPVLHESSNNDYRTAWTGGGMNTYQRNLDTGNVQGLTEWWTQDDTISPNCPLIWLPGHIHPGESDQSPTTALDVMPSVWARALCHACGADASQYGGFDLTWHFDSCRNCGLNWRPGLIIDGQHRTRGMAMESTTYHEQPLFCSVLYAGTPLGVSLEQAARLFIEINAGAEPLDKLHQEYLASHFQILAYEDPQRHAAYSVGVELNSMAGAGANNEWAQDTGLVPRIGRVTLMPGGPQVDYLSARRIRELIQDSIMEVEVTIPSRLADGSAGRPVDVTPYMWDANPVANVNVLISHFRLFLRAITNVWPGIAGPKSAPRWHTDRGERGGMQEKRVLRVLIRSLPSIMARIDEQGLPRSLPNIENELRAIGNIGFDGPWNGWLTGDPGIDRLHRVLTTIFRTAPYPTAADHWDIGDWYGAEHDPIEIVNLTVSETQVEFSTTTTCREDAAIQTPVSLLGLGTSMIQILNVETNEEITSTATLAPGVGNNVIDFVELGMAEADPNDQIEVTVTVSTPNNQHHVFSNTVSAIVP